MSAQSFIVRKVLMSLNSIAQAGTEYSDAIAFDVCEGELALLVVSTAGTVTISQQVSLDNVTFYDPVDSAGSALGVICTAKAVTAGSYIAINPVVAPYSRFKVTETNTAATIVSLTVTFRASRR